MPHLVTIRRSSREKKKIHENSCIRDETSGSEHQGQVTMDAAKYPRTGRRGAPQVFPRKLYEILTDEQDTISWTKNGKSFVISDMETFSNDVLLSYFRHQKYSSFQRQLNLYGFKKICKGPDVGAYAHDFFERNKPEQLKYVRRLPQGAKTRLEVGSIHRTPTPDEDISQSPSPSQSPPSLPHFDDHLRKDLYTSSESEADEEEKCEDGIVGEVFEPFPSTETPPCNTGSRSLSSNEVNKDPGIDDVFPASMYSLDDENPNELSVCDDVVRVQPLPEECIIPRSAFITEIAVDGLSAIVDKIALDRLSSKSPPLAVATPAGICVENADPAAYVKTPASLSSMIPVLARVDSSFPRLEIEKDATDALSSTGIEKEMVLSPLCRGQALGRLSSFGWNMHPGELDQFTSSDLDDIWEPSVVPPLHLEMER